MAGKTAKLTGVEIVEQAVQRVDAAFKEYEISSESTRNLHYRAIAQLYEYVAEVLPIEDVAIDALFEEKGIKRNAPNQRNVVLPYIKLVFGKVEKTDKTKKVRFGKGKKARSVEVPVVKNTLDKSHYRYAAHVRWLIQNEVPFDEAAQRLRSKTLEKIEEADRKANPDPNAATNEANRTKKRNDAYTKFKKTGGWGNVQIELTSLTGKGKTLAPGLVDVILDVQEDGSALLMWVNKEPHEAGLKSKVNADNDGPRTNKNVIALDALRKKAGKIRASAQATTGPNQSEFVVREA